MWAASKIGETYTPSVSLVAPNEMRIKLAKLAVAAAVLCFSTEDGQSVVVEPEHVMWVLGFLDQLYSTKSMGYRLMSDADRRKREMSAERRDKITEELRKYPHCRPAMCPV